MKKKLLLASTVFMALNATYAQEGVGIGKSILPDAAAVLDIGSDTKGVLIPRITLSGEGDTSTIKGGATYPESLLVYHKKGGISTLESGFYFWLGGKWNALVSKTSTTTSEVLTTLEISADGQKAVLTYTGEDKKPVVVPISDRLQKDPSFESYIKSLVSSTSAGVKLEKGNGIDITSKQSGTPEKPETTYTISTNPTTLTLVGDVSGNAGATSVDKIKGVAVAAAVAADDKKALVYDEATKTWKPGKPIVEITDIQSKANLTADSSIEVVKGGTGAVLTETELKVKASGIVEGHLAAGAVTETKILDKAVTTAKIADANVTPAKIAAGGATTILKTNAAGAVIWEAQEETAVTGGTGVTVTNNKVGNVKTYTVTADPTKITLGGDVTGAAGTNVVAAIRGVNVDATKPTVDGQALIFDGTSWKPGMPKLDGSNVTFTKALQAGADGVIKVDNGTAAMLKDVTLSINAGTIKSDMIGTGEIKTTNIADVNVTEGKLAADAVTTAKIKDANVTEGKLAADAVTTAKIKDANVTEGKLATDAVTTIKIKDANVTPAKIAAGGATTILKTNAAGAVIWEAQEETAVTGGTGVTVTNNKVGNVKTYTVTADPTKITLGGDVTGAAGTNVVAAIRGVNVDATKPTVDGQALIFDGTSWKPGMPKLDGSNVTFTKALQAGADGVIKVDNGTAAMLKDVTLSINAGTIKSNMIGAGEIKTANIADVNVTEGKLAADAVTTAKIANGAVTDTKIKGGADGTVLVSNAAGGTSWVAQNKIVPQGENLTGADGTIVVVTGGTGATLKETSLKVGDTSIGTAHLAANAVTKEKVKGEGNDMVLSTDATGTVGWTAKSTIATKATLTTDGSIVVGLPTDAATTATESVLKATTLSIKEGGISTVKIADNAVTNVKVADNAVTNAKIATNTITVDKLATVIDNKNKVLGADSSGKPQWESRNRVISNVGVPTNEVMDGKKVYVIRIDNGTVINPTGTTLGYNSAMEAIAITNFESLLTADIYKGNKLLLRNVTDVVNSAGSVSFRFGMNNMYTVLPVASDYKVVIRYVSNEAAN